MSSPERTSSSSAAAAAVVTPKISAAKKKKQASAKKPRPTAAEAAERRRLRLEAQGENSIFNRGQHRGKTFAEVAKLDPDYHVRYMHILDRKGKQPNTILTRYINWFNNTGGASVWGAQSTYGMKRRAGKGIGNDKFTSGIHKGQTFRQVAREDPSYHLRCQETGFNPGGMDDYRDYFARYGDDYAAARHERDHLGFMLGIVPVEMSGQYK